MKTSESLVIANAIIRRLEPLSYSLRMQVLQLVTSIIEEETKSQVFKMRPRVEPRYEPIPQDEQC